MKTNLLVLMLSIFGGILLIISGTQGPVGIFLIVLEKLPLFIQDPLIFNVTAMIVLFLIILSSMGGFTVILGGYLTYKNHKGTGKLLIGLGAGVGIPWLIFLLYTIIVTQELTITAIITQHSIIGWIGITVSFIARSIAR